MLHPTLRYTFFAPAKKARGEANSETCAQTKNTPPPLNLKRKFFIRVSAFTVLELGFLGLAFAAVHHPIPLNLPSKVTLTEAKGAFTVLSILWHALAIFIVRDTLLHVFSTEWMEQYHKTGNLVPGKTDTVSRMTAGFFDQLSHIRSNQATNPFRVALLCSLLLVLLNAIGPSAISVSSIFLDNPLTIKVANLTIFTAATDNTERMVESNLDRTNLVVRMELLEDVNYGFQSQANTLIPWPSQIWTNRTLQYETDVVTFNFSCSWERPETDRDCERLTNNTLWCNGPSQLLYGDSTPARLPSLEAIVTSSAVSGVGYSSWSDHPHSTFWFVGSNSTMSRNGAYLDLEDITTGFLSPFLNLTHTKDWSPTSITTLVASLVCDPHLKLAPATVTISNGTLQAVTRTGPPILQNFPIEVANLISSQSLSIPISSPDITSTPWNSYNAVAQALFLQDLSFILTQPTRLAKPLPLAQINSNMNRALLSSAKIFLREYRPSDNHTPSPYATTSDTNATTGIERLVLTGSSAFLVSLSAVLCTLVILLGFLVVGIQTDRLQTFDLENILKTLNAD